MVFRKNPCLHEHFLSCVRGMECGIWVRRTDKNLAHVQQPAPLSLVCESMDDEACLAVQLEVGSLDGGWVGGRDHLVKLDK